MKKIIITFTAIILYTITFGQEISVLKSNFIPGNDTILVIKPQSYNAQQKYPTVILLHGWSSNYTQWNTITNLQSYADLYGFIFICPDGFYDSWYLNSPKLNNWQFEDFFFDEFIPYINSTFSIDKNNVFISGLSMGGHGALHLFITHPQIFKAAGSTSGVLDLESRKINFGLQKLLGNYETSQENWSANSNFANIEKLTKIGKPIYIDCGISDPFFKMNQKFVQKAIELNIPISFYFTQGNHNIIYWNKSIAQQLAFFYKLSKN